MEKNWNAMEKLWKSYGISFLGICTNPVIGTEARSSNDEHNPVLQGELKNMYNSRILYQCSFGLQLKMLLNKHHYTQHYNC